MQVLEENFKPTGFQPNEFRYGHPGILFDESMSNIGSRPRVWNYTGISNIYF